MMLLYAIETHSSEFSTAVQRHDCRLWKTFLNIAVWYLSTIFTEDKSLQIPTKPLSDSQILHFEAEISTEFPTACGKRSWKTLWKTF